MGSLKDFACLGKPLLLIYEEFSNSERVYPIACFDKSSRTIVPFEKGIFDNLQAAIDYICWILTSSQVKDFLKSLEAMTLKELNKLPDFQKPKEDLRP